MFSKVDILSPIYNITLIALRKYTKKLKQITGYQELAQPF